jgi:hypothetical protein
MRPGAGSLAKQAGISRRAALGSKRFNLWRTAGFVFFRTVTDPPIRAPDYSRSVVAARSKHREKTTA